MNRPHRKAVIIRLPWIVRDGAVCFYVRDVLPEPQEKGIGHRIMDRLMACPDKNAPAGWGGHSSG
uniref:Uncharacterized protein n=1 Tax=Candidatus Kentrum sp. DK TaxID=2126562 RepID=A0A450SX63_9GAMM|nr:MAG: hypothetical protein BECKDK2373B_GA0170837_107621 [Candidatus Kentron sp. DK]